MTLSIVLRPAAEVDLLIASEWYETRSPGLGTDFARAVETCFALMQRIPHGFQVATRDIRRARLRRFPYTVYYIPGPEQIVVLGVLHVRRHPREWQHRV